MSPQIVSQRCAAARAAHQSATSLCRLAEVNIRQARRQLRRVIELLTQSSARIDRLKTLRGR